MSGGILGNQLPQGQGILGGINNFLDNNQAATLGMAAGLLSGDWGSGLQGFTQGMAQDERTRLIKLKQAEEEQRKVAARQLAEKMGKPELAQFPELAGQLYVAQNKPKGHQLVGSPETGYAWVQEGGDLPDNLKTGIGPKPTDDQRELAQINRERAALGQPPLLTEEFLKSKRGPQTVIQNMPAKVEFEEDKERAKSVTGFLGGVASSAPQIAQRNADLAVLGRVVSKTPTGQGAETRAFLDGVGKQLGLSSGQLKTQRDAIEAITQRIAPTLRQAGSGSQSDAELKGFLSSLTSLSATPEGNQIIMATLQRAAKLDMERAKIASQWQAGDMTASEARRKIAILDEQSIYGSDKEREIVENLMGAAPLSGGANSGNWKILEVFN